MNTNIDAGYGRALFTKMGVGLTTGKTFVVGKSALAYSSMYRQMFRNDVDGVVRYANTIAAAIALCTANAGDQILVLPGHTESVASAGALAVNVAGISIIGLGNGSDRGTITFTTATTATMTISADNVTIRNLIFTQSFDAIVSPLVISGANCVLKDNYFMVANASYQATQMILTTAAANNLMISWNRFVGTSDAGTTAAVTLVGGDNCNITDNDFIGAYSSGVGAIRSITTLNTNCVIRRNTIVNVTASATKGITLLTGSTGVIAENKFGIGSGAVPITADAAWWMGNWSAAAVATNGTLV